jgi:hypothetical protein
MKARQLPTLLVLVLGSVLAMATEEPAYRVIEKSGAFEIRDYGRITIAETRVTEDFDSAGNQAFGTLFSYISGKNQPKQKIAMTAPVMQQAQTDGSYLVGFIAPAQYSLRTAPAPADGSVQLRELPPQRMAVIRYSGRWTEKNFREHEAQLLAQIRARNLSASGPVIYARYNAPFVPWPMRRNEVMVPVLAVDGH